MRKPQVIKTELGNLWHKMNQHSNGPKCRSNEGFAKIIAVKEGIPTCKRCKEREIK